MKLCSNDYRIVYLNQFYTIEQIEKYSDHSETRLQELYDETQPIDVDIADLYSVNAGDVYLCDSPDGWVPIELWRNKGVKNTYWLVVGSGIITASDDHLFQTPDGSWVHTRDLREGDLLLTRTGDLPISRIEDGGKQTVYDLAIGHENHRYYTNGICSHNSGKSLVLQNLALNWTLAGHNVIYFTLELAEDHTSLKIDAMLTRKGTRDVVRQISDSSLLIKMRGKQAGRLYIKKYPEGGTNCNDFRAYLKEYEIINGHVPDCIIIDYLDLVHPIDKRIDPSNLFIKDKFVSEEIRGLMHEANAFGATASQLTRGSIEAMGEFDQSHTAGGISKINTSDNAIALYAPPSHKERGEFEFIMLKTRSSSGVGQRLKLAYDPTCMRITDRVLSVNDVDKPSTYEDLRKELKDREDNRIDTTAVRARGDDSKAEPDGQSVEKVVVEPFESRLAGMMARKRGMTG